MSFTSHVERMQRNRDTILDLLLGPKDDKGKRWLPLSDRAIRDLVRRGQHLPSDAYRANSMPEHVSGGAGQVVEDDDGTRATVTLTSVEAQVNAEMFGRTVFDNVGTALKRIDSELDKAARAARQADLARSYVEKVAAKMLGRAREWRMIPINRELLDDCAPLGIDRMLRRSLGDSIFCLEVGRSRITDREAITIWRRWRWPSLRRNR